jgi:hypothetical protein
MILDHIHGLTNSERVFLYAHDIPGSLLFDVSGLRRVDYVEIMQQRDLLFAYNAKPCQAAGHRLRTRAGHCIVCRPAAIAFIKRYVNPGTVYVAYSPASRLV